MTPETDWPKRLENLRVIMAKRRVTPTQVAREAGLGVNTVNSIVSGKTRPRHDTLEAICRVLGIHNVAVLDSDNPISDVRNELFRLVGSLSEDQARALLERARKVAGNQE